MAPHETSTNEARLLGIIVGWQLVQTLMEQNTKSILVVLLPEITLDEVY